jgi:3'-phosphoadenosine 5'-phosphosulfate (PAPS) 3'-phosphatase
VSSSAELAVGQEIEAWYQGSPARRGRVVDTLQSTNLFWIMDPCDGTQRLLDTEEFTILKVAAPLSSQPARRV